MVSRKSDEESRHLVGKSTERRCVNTPTLQSNTLVWNVLQILAVTGEFPWSSLHLLGNPPTVQKMVSRLSHPTLFRNPQTGKEIHTKLFVLNGKGREKSLRLYKGALPLLHWLHPSAYGYYIDSFWNHHFPGDSAHRNRNHRVAETVALCGDAGVNVLPYDLPRLQQLEIRKVTPDEPALYLARDIKKAFPGEEKKTMFTRAVGALFFPGGCYAVYNTRDAAMKWKGMGEFKALHSLTEVARWNGGITRLTGAVLMGKSYEAALSALEYSDPRHPELRFDSIYPHIHFVPLDPFGARLLRLLTLPSWEERLLDLLFEPSTRTYGQGMMECDAQVGGVWVLSHLDGDIARLLRFREGLWSRQGKAEVVCFPQQVPFVEDFLGGLADLRVVELDAVEEGVKEP